MDNILLAREREIKNLQKIMKDDNVYLTLKANVPGQIKRTDISIFLINVMKKRIYESFTVTNENFFDDYDGFYYIFSLDEKNRLSTKLAAIALEESDAIGRYVDIDVFQNETKSLSRSDLNIKSRKCFICGNNPYICMRNKTHSLEEINNKIYNDIIDFIEKETKIIVEESINLELSLDPKFGMVTSKNKGSHSDMDFNLMNKTKDVITPYIALMTVSGFCNNIKDIRETIKKIGLLAEEKMFRASGNINTYKGLIFSIGYAASGFGYILKNNLVFNKLFDVIKEISNGLEDELLFPEKMTFGVEAYRKYGLTGARGEIINGMPSVVEGLEILDKYNNFGDEALTMTLIKIISKIDDTVLLKRAGSIEKYNYYKDLVGSIKGYDVEKISKITDECISNNISFGGASDLLAVTVFIQKMKKRFYYV